MMHLWELIRYSTVMMYLHDLIERTAQALEETFTKETFMQLLKVLKEFSLIALHILLTPVSFSKHKGIHRYSNGDGVVSVYEVPLSFRMRYVGVHHRE